MDHKHKPQLNKRNRLHDNRTNGNDQENLDEHDLALIESLRGDLDDLDRLAYTELPELNALAANIAEHQTAMRRKFWRDLGIFLLIALCLLGAFFAISMQIPYAFAAIQLLAAIGVPIALLLYKAARKRVKA